MHTTGQAGKRLWSFDADAAVLAPPITYRAHGRQYVTVLSGFGATGALFGPPVAKLGWDSRTQARRVLTFALDAKATLPPGTPPAQPKPVEDRDFKPDDAAFKRGQLAFGYRCVVCHGMNAMAAGLAPDLRASVVPQSAAAFDAIVRDGALVSRGMPRYQILTDRSARTSGNTCASWRGISPRPAINRRYRNAPVDSVRERIIRCILHRPATSLYRGTT